MKDLLDAIDIALSNTEEGAGVLAGHVIISAALWEQICIERAKIEPEAPELLDPVELCKRLGLKRVAGLSGAAEWVQFPPNDALEMLPPVLRPSEKYREAALWALSRYFDGCMHTEYVAVDGPDILANVRAFLAIGHPHMLAPEPGVPEFGTEQLCRNLITEELAELDEGRTEQDLVKIADAVQDLIWVVACLGFAYGLPMPALWAEVARTNMAKFPGGVVTRRPEDGKIMKPEGWQPPRIGEIVAAAFLPKPEGS